MCIRDSSEILDVYGFRILVDSVDDCYRSLGIIHNYFSPIGGKFKDYIAIPKTNGYQALHTSLLALNAFPIEVQIQTRSMWSIANMGIAAHWGYKTKDESKGSELRATKWLSGLIDLQKKSSGATEFAESIKKDLDSNEVYLFSPKGHIYALKSGATPIDFAYAVHTKIGNSTIACKINGNDSELQSILYNGDVVDIITSKNKSPSLHWIPVTKTGKARSAIRKYWYKKGEEKAQRIKKYNTTLWISLPDKPGKLGEITTLLGSHSLNISSVEMKEKSKEYINFKFNLIIRDLKNFTNFISELKQKEIKFKIIRHEDNWLKERNAFTRKIFKYFKKN